MATRMTDTDPSVRNDEVYARPVVWPWVLLAIVIALALWWAAANNARNTGNGISGPGTTNSAPGITPGTGTTGAPMTGPAPVTAPTPGTLGGPGAAR